MSPSQTAGGTLTRTTSSPCRNGRPCTACHGKRLRDDILAVTLGNGAGEALSIQEFTALDIDNARRWLESLAFTGVHAEISGPIVDELRKRLDFLIEVVEGMSEARRMSDGEYFGTPMPVHASVATAMADMHEHLGQLIAYARTNHVVPPWSRGG